MYLFIDALRGRRTINALIIFTCSLNKLSLHSVQKKGKLFNQECDSAAQ